MKNLKVLIKVVYYMSKALGILPFVINLDGEEPCKVSALSVVYSVIVTLAVDGYIAFYMVSWAMNLTADDREEIAFVPTLISNLAVPIIRFLTMMTCLLNRRSLSNCVRTMLSWQQTPSDKYGTLLLVLVMVANLLLITVSLLLSLAQNANIGFIYPMIFMYAAYGIFLGKVQFVMLVTMLRRYIRNINDALRVAHERKVLLSVESVNGWLLRQESMVDVSVGINSAYSTILLFTVAQNFWSITYFLYVCLCNGGENLGERASLGSVCALLHLVFAFIILTWSCEKTANEAKETGVQLHKLLARTQDPYVRQELQIFSLQLLQRKVKFTVCGFFPLNFTLLHSIAAAVTTYLVILIQFRQAGKNTP